MTDKKTQGHKDSGTQRHKKTKTRGQKDTGRKRHGDKKTQGHKDTGTKRHRDTKTHEGHKDTGGTQRHRRRSLGRRYSKHLKHFSTMVLLTSPVYCL